MKTTTLRICDSALALALTVSAAVADATDFRFDLVSREHRVGAGVIVAVRLTNLRLDEPVDRAVIYATRMDRAPAGMATVTTTVTAMPADVPGICRFVTDLSMAGAGGFRLPPKCRAGQKPSRLKSNCGPNHECAWQADSRSPCRRHRRMGRADRGKAGHCDGRLSRYDQGAACGLDGQKRCR